MRVIAFANQKGGVGKTTSAVTLAHGLAQRGRSVLLVDLDAQGQAALSLGFSKAPGLYHFLSLEEPLQNCLIQARPNLDLLPGDKSTEKIKREIALLDFRQTILSEHLLGLNYDTVVLDLAPSLDVLHLNGLAASDYVVIPTRLERLSIDGVREILLTLAEMDAGKKCNRGYELDKSKPSPNSSSHISTEDHFLRGFYVLPTFFERLTRETLLQFQELVQAFSTHVWPPIPRDAAVRSASAQGKTLWESGRSSPALEGFKNGRSTQGGYRQVLDRLMEVLNGEENKSAAHCTGSGGGRAFSRDGKAPGGSTAAAERA